MSRNSISRFFWSTASMLVLMCACGLTSCLSEDEVVTSSECAIVSFSVGSIKSEVKVKKYDSNGNATDTIVTRTISGSEIVFNIDQVNGHIYTVDSLPNWVNLTKVVPSFTTAGLVFAQIKPEGAEDSLYYHLTSGSDSIDFSKPVKLVCAGTDAVSSKTYTVEIYKSESNIDTLEWTQMQTSLSVSGFAKPFCLNGMVYVFAKNGEGKPVVAATAAANSNGWSAPSVLSNENIDCATVTVFNNSFYALDSEGYIYTASTVDGAKSWTKASEQKVDQLLGADKFYIYAVSDGSIKGSADLTEWAEQGGKNLDKLPTANVNMFSYPSKTNASIYTSVLTGNSDSQAKNGVAWFKMSSLDANVNQSWDYISIANDNLYGFPKMDNLSVTYYKGALYAIGSQNGMYSKIYRSADNGIAWQPLSDMYPLPGNLSAANGAASIVAVESDLWIIQENGTVWQGSIR